MPVQAVDFSAHVHAYRLNAGARDVLTRTRVAIDASRRLLAMSVVPLQSLPPYRPPERD